MTASDLILRYEGRLAVESGRVRELRTLARLSQTELAKGLGVTAACVSRWEAGERIPRGEAAVRLASLLREIERAVAAP